MTDFDLDAIRTRTNAATEGPWAHPNYDDHESGWDILNGEVGAKQYCVAFVSRVCNPRHGEADAEFIRHTRTDVPALLDIAEDARYIVGDLPCVEGECDHPETDGAPCPLLKTRYATSGDVLERDGLRTALNDAAAEIQRMEAALASWPSVIAEVDRLRSELATQKRAIRDAMTRVRDLTVSTDGVPLGHDEDIPVGEIVRVLAESESAEARP